MVNGISMQPGLKPNFFMISAPKQIIPKNEAHETEHQEQPGPIGHLHHSLRNGPPDDGLHAVEQQVAAVERGNRQEIEKSYSD
jgi:hypothetical protein